MKKAKTKQIYILNLNYPFESVHMLLFESELIKKIYLNTEYKLKLFIGSNWSIKNSGFSLYGPDNVNIAFELKNITKNDFIRENVYSITYINDINVNLNLEFIFSLYNNTSNSNSIIELRVDYASDDDLKSLEENIKLSKIKEIVNLFYEKVKLLYKQNIPEKEKPKVIWNHSFIIKKNYKEAFNFFYNWNNMAKTLKTDKIWKIINEENSKSNEKEYKNFSILINDDIKIFYRVVSINEIKDEKIEIIFDKSGKNYVPALNNYIKFTFFNINKNLSLFLYETHFPFNIYSSIFQTVCYYLFYCNNKSKNYIENL